MFGRRKKAEPQFKLHMPWRENLETLSAAIVMALVLKFFVVEAYKIPTGSMQPTLMGDDGTQIYDRILVDKFSFVFRDPERWEVVVFKYPLDLVKNYVKRLVGMPGEKLAVADGNLWAATDPAATLKSPAGTWKILRKPVEVQRDLWKELWTWEAGEKSPERKVENNEDNSRYAVEVTEGSWSPKQGAMQTGAAQPFRMIWPSEQSVRDLYWDGYPDELTTGKEKVQFPGRSLKSPHYVGMNQVGDLRFDLELVPESDVSEIELAIRAYGRIHLFHINGPAGNGESFVLWNQRRTQTSDDNPRSAFDRKLTAGEAVTLRAEACDQRLRLLIDGEEVARVEYDTVWASWESTIANQDPAREFEAARNSDDVCRVELAVRGTARVESMRTYRDIHYLPEMSRVEGGASKTDWANEFTLLHPDGECTPAEHYFMMGDNTQNSLDSRGWKKITLTTLDGIEVSGNYNGQPASPDTNPRPLRSGSNTERGLLESVTGQELRVLRTITGRDVLVTEKTAPAMESLTQRPEKYTSHAPYVGRDLIVGKAVVVFWPIKPFAATMRWKFVR